MLFILTLLPSSFSFSGRFSFVDFLVDRFGLSRTLPLFLRTFCILLFLFLLDRSRYRYSEANGHYHRLILLVHVVVAVRYLEFSPMLFLGILRLPPHLLRYLCCHHLHDLFRHRLRLTWLFALPAFVRSVRQFSIHGCNTSCLLLSRLF